MGVVRWKRERVEVAGTGGRQGSEVGEGKGGGSRERWGTGERGGGKIGLGLEDGGL